MDALGSPTKGARQIDFAEWWLRQCVRHWEAITLTPNQNPNPNSDPYGFNFDQHLDLDLDYRRMR